MTDERVAGADVDVATGVGLVLLSEASVPEAAEYVGVTQWELEDAIERADLADRCGLDGSGDVAAEIDSLLDAED